MKKSSAILLIILGSALIGVGVFIYLFIFKLEFRIEHRVTPEIGQEIIVFFNQPIGQNFLKKHLEINPDIDGQFVWLDSNRELHIIPKEGLEANIAYQLNLGGLRGFVSNRFKKKSISVPPAKIVLASFLPPIPQMLPLGKDVFFEKSNKEIVEINKPQIIKERYIDIDLSKMILTAFDNNQPVAVYEVSAIGNPQRWPTPRGEFKVLHKEENHFSGISHVWMPWSIHFYGDYFIHEVPYWPSGQKVTSKYSGGCIRLPAGAAKLVYDWVEIGTPVMVH